MTRRAEWLVAGAFIFACSVALLWPILSLPDWYVTRKILSGQYDEAHRYPYLFDFFRASFLSGHFYPRWLPELMGGYGYPTFVYYPPGFWFIALPFGLLLEDTASVMHAAMVAIFFIGGVGAYKLARHFQLTLVPALVCTFMFMASPYALMEIYWVGALSEWLGLMLCPWVLFCYIRLSDALERGRDAKWETVWLAVSGAALFYGHPLVGFWMAFAVAVLAAAERRKALFPYLLAAVVLALALSAPYWFNLLALEDAIDHSRARFLRRFFTPGKLFASWPYSFLHPYLLLAAAGGCVIARRRKHAIAALVLMLFFLFMLSPWSREIWLNAPLLKYTLFPRRIFAVLPALQLLGVIFLLQNIPARLAKAAPAAVIALSLIYVPAGITIGRTMDYEAFKERMAMRLADMTYFREFMPVDAQPRGLPPRIIRAIPAVEALQGIILMQSGDRADDMKITVKTPATLRVNQFWFPGWRVAVDGREVDPGLDSKGRMTVSIAEEGEAHVRVWYAGPPYWLARNVVALIVSALTLAWLWRRDRRKVNA